MNRLLALLLTLHLGVDARLRARDERGSVTTEQVLWAVAVIAIVGIVVAVIKATLKARPARSSRRRQDERGSVSIQMVILLPALFAVMFLGMQAALFYHARTVAIAAAQEGAGPPAARTASGRRVSAASSFITDAGGDDV